MTASLYVENVARAFAPLVIVAVVLGWLGCSAAPTGPSTLRTALSDVGMVRRPYVDDARRSWEGTGSRPLQTSIWYPASSGAPLTDILSGESLPFKLPRVATGAPVAVSSQPRPLVLLSHGTGGAALQHMWLGHYLAARGFIVAAVNHHGNTAAEQRATPGGFLLFWERARDLSVALDRLLADPIFAAHIDRQRIGAAGFSLGGYTVIEVAGGKFSQAQFESFCRSRERDNTCEPQPEFPDAAARLSTARQTDSVVQESLRRADDSYRDDRIKAIFVMAPALGGGFSHAALQKVTAPVQLVVGESDTSCPLRTNAERFAASIPGAKLKVLGGGVGHYAFLAECTARGRRFVPICRDAAGVDRRQVHEQVAALAYDFFSSTFARNRRTASRTRASTAAWSTP